MRLGDVAQLGERRLCKPEVAGSIPVVSTVPRRGAGPGETLRIGAATAPGASRKKISENLRILIANDRGKRIIPDSRLLRAAGQNDL